MIKYIKPFIAGTVFMLVFGFIDNIFVVYGSFFTEIAVDNIDVAINGGLWNTVSDAFGVIVAASVSSIISKWLGIKEENTTFTQQLSGVVLGCLIPILIYLIFK